VGGWIDGNQVWMDGWLLVCVYFAGWIRMADGCDELYRWERRSVSRFKWMREDLETETRAVVLLSGEGAGWEGVMCRCRGSALNMCPRNCMQILVEGRRRPPNAIYYFIFCKFKAFGYSLYAWSSVVVVNKVSTPFSRGCEIIQRIVSD
jgi:hypothetical protein